MTMHGGIKKCGFCKDLVRSFIRRLILAAGRGGVIHARIDRKKFPQRGVRGEETSAGRVLCLVWKCAMMEDVFELVAEEFDGQMGTGRVETERNPLLTARYRISRLPSFLLFVGGEVVLRMTGVMEPEEMAKRLESKKI